LGWSAADPADAIVAARVCLKGRGLLPAANKHDIAQQQRIGPQSLLSGRAEFWPVLDLQVQNKPTPSIPSPGASTGWPNAR
jgi:hypothetical protein